MFYVKFFTFSFLLLFCQLQANNPTTKNISLQKVIHSFQLSPLKNKTQTDSLPLHKKSHIAVLVAQQVEKNKLLDLESCTKSEAKIFDINAIQSHIVYVIHKFKELCIKWMTSACEKDSGWVQLEDVYFNGRYYRYHVLSDAARKETKWDSCNLWPYDDSAHCLSFDDRAEFEAALRGGASVAQIYKMAGLYPDGSPYLGEMRVSNIQGCRSSSDGSSTSSQDLMPSKGTSTGGTSSGQQNGSSTASQGGGASSGGVSSGNSGGLTTATSGKYDVDPSKQQPVQLAPQQSLSSPTGLQTVDARDAVTKNAIQQQNQQTLKNFEAYLDQANPDARALIIKDREEVLDAHNGVRKIQKAENPGRFFSFLGRKPEINVSYTDQQVQQAQLIVKAGQQNPHSHRQQVLNQAHKIVQVDAAAKAEALKNEQERIAAAKKASDEKKAFDDQQSKLNEIQKGQGDNQPLTSFGTQVLNSVVAAYKKDCDEGGRQKREYERKMQEEQQSIIHQRYIQQQKAEQHRASIIQDKYTQQRKIEIAYLGRHGYTYQPSEQDLIELTIHQLRLESARNRYNSMNTLSYDYLMSSKAAELKKLIQDSDAKVHNLQNKITKQRYEWDKKSLQEIADKKKSEKIVPGQAGNARNESAHELLDVEKIDDIVDVKNLTQYVHPTDDSTLSQDLVKDSEHRYTMPSTIAQAIRNKLIDRDNEYSNKVSADEIAMIDYMLHAMVKAQNNMTVEYAQAGLQACDDAQHAKTDEEYIHHMKKAELYYNTIKNGQANYSIADKAAQVKASDLDAMLQNYNNVLEGNKNTALPNQQQTNNHFIDRFEKRVQAITESQEQLRTNKLISCDFKMSSQARGYLMANNLNYAAFDTIKATSIQHCLTRENLEIIESVTEMAQRHGYTAETKEFVKQICSQAITAQQLNQRSDVEAAALLTDLNYINAYFAQIPEGKNLILDLAIGTAQGHTRFLCKWAHFLKNLCQDPQHSVNEMRKDLCAIGSALCNVASAAYDFTPLAKGIDITVDCFGFRPEQTVNEDGTITTYTDQRRVKKLQTIEHIVTTSNAFVEYIKKNSVRKIITDTTELADGIGADAYLINKAIIAAGSLAGKVGQNIAAAGDGMYDLLPVELMDDVVTYAKTSTGEIVAVSEQAGINLGAAAANQTAAHRAAKVTKAKELTHDIQQLTKADKVKIAKLQASFEKYYKSDALLPGLEKIDGIQQIENYRTITKNFTTIEHLTEADVMYLNMCNGLHAHSVEINELVKNAMLQLVDQNGKIIEIKKFDIFHSFLGEMKPNVMGSAKKGGHLLFPESKAFTHVVEEIIPFENGYFDLSVKHIGDKTGKLVQKTQFPLGSTPMENARTIIDLIKKVKNPIKIDVNGKGVCIFNLKHQCGQEFTVYVENGIAHFHPLSPNAHL